MPRHSTLPTLYEDCKKVCISELKRWGYLNPNEYKGGTITWSRNGNKTGSISIAVNTHSGNPYIELDYSANGTPIKYTVQLVSIPSNIGKGVVWYFVCPKTGKRCRKLYLVETYFYHRSAFRGCMYEKQTYSKKNRQLFGQYEILFAGENDLQSHENKYFKRFYNGKPTQKYLKILKKLNKLEGYFNNRSIF